MADREHLQILQEGVAKWNAWRNRNVAVRPDLSGAELCGLQLDGANLASVDLSGAVLGGVVLDGADLQFADLRCAHGLERIARSKARNIVLAQYSAEILSKLSLGPDHNDRLLQRNLSGYKCRAFDFRGARLAGFDLSGAVLTDCNFFGADLSRTKLTGSDLRSCVLERSDLTDADLSRALLTYANLRKACMRRATLCGADLQIADFLEADLYNADLGGVTFRWRRDEPDLLQARNYIFIYCGPSLSDALNLRSAANYPSELALPVSDEAHGGQLTEKSDHNDRVHRKTFAGYDFSGLRLEGLDLRGWDLSNTRCEGTSFRGADLTECRLDGAFLVGAIMSDAKLGNSSLIGANLRATLLDGADLHHAKLNRADLQAAKLQRANLTCADLADARMSAVRAQDAVWTGANLSRCDFEGADLTRAEFTDATLDACILVGAILEDTKLVRTKLRWARTDGANFSRADWHGANIQGTDFQGAGGLTCEAILQTSNNRLAMYDLKFLDQLGFPNPSEHNDRVGRRHFSGLNFAGCIMRNAVLDNATLEEAVLTNCELDGASFEGARLREAVLDKASLRNVNFGSADLTSASLVGAMLDGSRAEKAILTNANFRGASLARVSFGAANLSGALLRDAVLQGANLESVVGLYSDQLAATNINAAKLPPEMGRFTALANIEAITTSARSLVLSIVLLCGYAGIQVLSLSDGDLLANRSILSSPLLDMRTPALCFCFGGPIILLVVYLWMQFYLQHLWVELSQLPAGFQDSRPIYMKVYPWFLNMFVSVHFPILRKDRPLLTHLQVAFSVAVTWWLVPATTFLLWMKYLSCHDKLGTGIQVGVLSITIAVAAFLQYLAGATLRGEQRRPIRFYRPNRTQRKISAMLLVVTLIFLMWSWGAIAGCGVADTSGGLIRQRLFALMSRVCVRADVVAAEISTKNTGWRGNEESFVTGAKLAFRNLQGASGSRVFLAKADLRRAHLENSDLRGADLRWADLSGAHLERARLSNADLRGADLRDADLTGAQLYGANLQQARIHGARLFGVLGLTTEQIETAIAESSTGRVVTDTGAGPVDPGAHVAK